MSHDYYTGTDRRLSFCKQKLVKFQKQTDKMSKHERLENGMRNRMSDDFVHRKEKRELFFVAVEHKWG